MATGTIFVVILLAVWTGNLLVKYQAALDKAHYLAYLLTYKMRHFSQFII
jgi:hypothetical protein